MCEASQDQGDLQAVANGMQIGRRIRVDSAGGLDPDAGDIVWSVWTEIGGE